MSGPGKWSLGGEPPEAQVWPEVTQESPAADTADEARAAAPADSVESEDDGYDDMEYADLQALAKARTGNGGGSRADIVERLRENDADNE